ncbi:MAG TPA: winged helix-turn-helix domain-containing protein [Vicinamibacterales bacterium]|nr:winged helix-turn-helix domain-containing protein [Vicinamibacterales bacterium]
MTYRFGPFVADRTAYRVSRGQTPVELTPKLLDLLFYLLDHPAALVTKEELLDGVWPGANVTDNALAQAVSDLRDALGDSPATPTYIRTIARRGYRFVAPVESADATPPRAPVPARLERPAPAAAGGPPTIAVLDFANVTEDPDIAWLGAGIAETVTSDLGQLDHFRVIDRWRVVQAARRTDGSLHEMAAALGAALVVAGSYQRTGTLLRITARVVDPAKGEAIADAKVDGPIEDVFTLQDGIVNAFARELGVPAASSLTRVGVRETSNLEAYRAYTEGWLRVESLDTDVIGQAIASFERAIALDPRYAIAYAGLASAEVVAYEMTRFAPEPNRQALASGIDHARHAVQLDGRLAEAHATLSFLLISAGQFDEARTAAQTAVAIDPESWRNQYRLGHALWGDARLRAFERARAIYPQFAYATFEMAMVHVARGHLSKAEDLVRLGVVEQDRQAGAGDRFPSIGFHWLLGALESARGRHSHAIAEFNQELAQVDRHRLYGPEYGAVALVARGHAELAVEHAQAAIASFQAARLHVEEYPRAWLGEAVALAGHGDATGADQARRRARAGVERFERTGRIHDALYAAACAAAAEGNYSNTLARLDQLLGSSPPSYLGWTIPIEPFFRPLHGLPGFATVIDRLADRAK